MFCSVKGCGRDVYAKGFCVAHYFRDRNGDLKAEVPVRPKNETRLCEIEGCENKHYGSGFCQMHYRRWKRSGETSVETRRQETCNVAGCDKPHDARGLCHGHYQRLMRDAEVNDEEPLIRKKNPELCSVEACGRKAEVGDLCKTHAGRLRKFGDVQANKPIKPRIGKGFVLHGYSHVPVPREDRWLTNGKTPYPEHRLVMARYLGRPLRPDESVHHKNGRRTDNREENLELWTRWQPVGQRVEDRVDDAVAFLRAHAPHLLLESAIVDACPSETGAAM